MKRIKFMAAAGGAVVGMLLGTTILSALADGPPILNVGQSCDAAARGAVSIGRDKAACMGDERAAQDLLGKNWSQYAPGNKVQCLGMNTHGGLSSYVELISCLEIMRDAAAIEKDDLASLKLEKSTAGGRQNLNRRPR
jgi:hypothetical protein